MDLDESIADPPPDRYDRVRAVFEHLPDPFADLLDRRIRHYVLEDLELLAASPKRLLSQARSSSP